MACSSGDKRDAYAFHLTRRSVSCAVSESLCDRVSDARLCWPLAPHREWFLRD